MLQLSDYECFIDAGIYNDDPIAEGYKKIQVHLMYNIKSDEHHKAHLISNGHLTDVLIESVYSGVISLCGL
jgi:hypothetical protein